MCGLGRVGYTLHQLAFWRPGSWDVSQNPCTYSCPISEDHVRDVQGAPWTPHPPFFFLVTLWFNLLFSPTVSLYWFTAMFIGFHGEILTSTLGTGLFAWRSESGKRIESLTMWLLMSSKGQSDSSGGLSGGLKDALIFPVVDNIISQVPQQWIVAKTAMEVGRKHENKVC